MCVSHFVSTADVHLNLRPYFWPSKCLSARNDSSHQCLDTFVRTSKAFLILELGRNLRNFTFSAQELRYGPTWLSIFWSTELFSKIKITIEKVLRNAINAHDFHKKHSS